VDPEPRISIIAVMASERELEVTSVMRVHTRASTFGTRSTELTAALLGSEGEPLAQASLRELRSQASCGCSGSRDGDDAGFPRVVQALVPDVGTGAALVIRRGEQELWSVRAPSRPPRIGRFTAKPDRDRLRVAWSVETEPESSELWLQWSGDRGETWNALATGLDGREAELDVAHLPAGIIMLRLLAGDGFHTTASESVRVELAERSPALSILTPHEGQVLVAGGSMRLWAAITHGDGGPGRDPVKARWQLDGEAIGEDLDTFIVVPSAGEHRLELEVFVGDQRAEVSTRYETVDVTPPASIGGAA
jgi:hypothetical protein